LSTEPIPSQATAHGLLAHAHRYGPPKKAEAAKATFVAAQLKRRIADALAEVNLTIEHRAELAALLTGEAGDR
jgi:hypothetical protein